MNLKEIRVYGFKSFVEKTEIEFNKGITAIVGPNGCGKSNFSDAIRWVLGESRPSILRIGNMSGLIFGGTDLRKPLSFCEVSVVFDNSTRIINAPYEEVVITRKAFRSGNSEFYLNGAKCRLQDIQDLLKDTGMGREGYSIIAQGKVSEIIQNPPKKRRALFEEAAGIALYKSRKENAVKELNVATENIEKGKIVINEIEKHLGPLKEQAKKARIARDLQEELKFIEVNQYIYQTDNSEQIRGEITKKIDSYQDEVYYYERQYAEKDEQYKKHDKKIVDLEHEIGSLKNLEMQHLLKKERLLGDSNLTNEKIKHCEEEIAKMTQFIESNSNDLNQKRDEVSSLKEKASSLEILVNNSKVKLNDKQKELESVAHEIAQYAIDSSSRENQRYQALAMIADIKVNEGKYHKEIELITEDIKELKEIKNEREKSIETKTYEKQEVENKLISAVNTKENAELLRKSLSDDIANIEMSLNLLTKEITDIEGKFHGQKNYLEYLKSARESYTSFQDSVRRLIEEAKYNEQVADKIEGLLVELIKVPKDYEAAVTAILGNTLQNVVTRNDEDAKYLINVAKEKRLGVITILPIAAYKYRYLEKEYESCLREKGVIGILSDLINYDKRYDPILIGLLGRTILCDNIENAVALARRYKYGFRIVTLEGDIISNTGAITGGKRSNDTNSLLATDRKIEEMSKELDEYSNTLAIKKKQKDNKEIQLYETKQDLEKSTKALDEAKEKCFQRNQDIEKIQNEIIYLESELSTQVEKLEQKENRLEVIQSALDMVNQEKNKVSHENANISNEDAKLKIEYGEKSIKKDQLNQEITELKLKIQNAEIEISNASMNLVKLGQEIEKLKLENSDYEFARNAFTSQLKEMKDMLKNTKLTEKEEDDYQKIMQSIAEFTKDKEESKKICHDIIIRKEEILNDINNKKQLIIKQEERLVRVNESIEQLEKHIFEEYNLSYDTAQEYKRAEFNYEESISKLTNVKREISKLGPVNYNAIEESQKQQERYDKQLACVQDLITAQNNLNQVIKDLSESMLTQFNNEFEKINKNFGEVFKELFGGGKAKLVILPPDEGEDELSAGIEIDAQPPGKNVPSINALSGGEQSMTAIAILFAILKVKAVPFCILDEIDAALDDSNVYLFANYLKKFSQDTQFIVITHRQPTMQASDILNGVTMQERGVSRVVKVTISEAMESLKDQEKITG